MSLSRISPVLLILSVLLCPIKVSAWTNGELSIWMDGERGKAVEAIGRKFEADLGLKISVESPDKITENFSIAAQAGKGPDIVIWAHDKVGEWADGGLIAPLTSRTSSEKSSFLRLGRQFYTESITGDIPSRLRL